MCRGCGSHPPQQPNGREVNLKIDRLNFKSKQRRRTRKTEDKDNRNMKSVETREKQVEMLKVGLSVSNMSPEIIKQTNSNLNQ